MFRHDLVSGLIAPLLVAGVATLALVAGDAWAQRQMEPAAPTLSVQPSDVEQGGFRLRTESPASLAGAPYHVEGSYRKAAEAEWVYPGTLAANVSAGTAGIEIPAALLTSIAPPDARWRFRVRVASPPGPWSEWAEAGAGSARVRTSSGEARQRRLRRAPGGQLNPATQSPAAMTEPAPGAVVGGRIDDQRFDDRPALRQQPGEPALLLEARPDYAIGLDWQFEYANTALAWRFRVENKGLGTPPVQPAGWMKTQSASATLVISRGNPCPKATNWTKLATFYVPQLKPGEATLVPADPYRMPDDKVGMGCQFKAQITGLENDANPANDTMQMISKVAPLPDLVVTPADDMGGPGGGLEVRNVGKAGAGPSHFRFECQSSDPAVTCGKPYENYQPKLVIDVPVPALNPNQAIVVRKSTPGTIGGQAKSVSWTATADHQKAVAESNEVNNVMKGGK